MSEDSNPEEQGRKALRGKEELQKDDAAEKARLLKEDFTKAELSRQREQEGQASEAGQQERDRQAAEAAERDREWHERERQLELFEREQARQQERRQQEIEAQRQREADGFTREKELLAIEGSGRKPAYADVKKAETLRNAHELNALQDRQQKAREDAFAGIDKMPPAEAAAAKEEKGKALEKQFKEELERLAREQQERAERLRELYREHGRGR